MNNSLLKAILLPRSGERFENQFSDCLNKITDLQKSSSKILVHVAFFVKAESVAAYRQFRTVILNRTSELFQNNLPISIIAQAPAGDYEIVAELSWFEHQLGMEYEYKEISGIPYLYVERNKCVEIFTGGISNTEPGVDLAAQIEWSFNCAKNILLAEGMDFSNVQRQWNYIEDILAVNSSKLGVIQNYQLFNNIRSKYYEPVNFNIGYPAATGIGMANGGGFVLEIYALKSTNEIESIAIQNPKQVDAYHYSDRILSDPREKLEINRSTPKFERARLIKSLQADTLFISGTASIQNEQTQAIDNISRQTEITMENIQLLIESAKTKDTELEKLKPDGSWYFRVYLKNKKDYTEVKEILENKFGIKLVNYLVADVCRDNLLIEIEAVLCYS